MSYTGHDWQDGEDITESLIQALDDGAAAALPRAEATATYLTLKAAAKDPELLIVGAITRNGNGQVVTAAVIWPDGTPGTYSALKFDASGAVNGYQITYGSPVAKTYTQPTMTRDSTGAVTTIPQITVA